MDRFRLEYELKKKGISVDQLCGAIGMSRTSYYRKLRGTSEFSLSEIQKIVDYAGLESPMGIFFKEKVS